MNADTLELRPASIHVDPRLVFFAGVGGTNGAASPVYSFVHPSVTSVLQNRPELVYTCGNATHPPYYAPGTREDVCTPMSKKDQSTTEKPIGEKHAKKLYTKPAFRHEKVFETMALACGKIHQSVPGCKFQRKFS